MCSKERWLSCTKDEIQRNKHLLPVKLYNQIIYSEISNKSSAWQVFIVLCVTILHNHPNGTSHNHFAYDILLFLLRKVHLTTQANFILVFFM